MTYYTLLLLIKVVITLVLVAIPFLLLPKLRLESATGSKHSSVLFFRLYGVAILALLVSYVSAIPLSQAGVFSWSIALTGLVSNSGAAVFLALMGKGKANVLLAIFFGSIAFFLVLSMMFPVLATSRIW